MTSTEEDREKKAPLKPQPGKQHYLASKEQQRQERKRQKRIEELESLISREEDILSIEGELAKPEISRDYTAYLKLSEELNQRKADLDHYLEEWVHLTEEA
ncbi:ABC transporter C-terminal domain-containing protein [Desulforamulus putei DSM 12395]|uniref:ABC transporter C-terminal domain-containing protein n=1 Tax=Desulforamulus putei DSM 12395 TaxID=1121429 RepID=A0A1M4SB02_9FIRM|nr:ABC transporter C-terminal domain-containing protein [Desulforamulus putei DSM 12395]